MRSEPLDEVSSSTELVNPKLVILCATSSGDIAS